MEKVLKIVRLKPRRPDKSLRIFPLRVLTQFRSELHYTNSGSTGRSRGFVLFRNLDAQTARNGLLQRRPGLDDRDLQLNLVRLLQTGRQIPLRRPQRQRRNPLLFEERPVLVVRHGHRLQLRQGSLDGVCIPAQFFGQRHREFLEKRSKTKAKLQSSRVT